MEGKAAGKNRGGEGRENLRGPGKGGGKGGKKERKV